MIVVHLTRTINCNFLARIFYLILKRQQYSIRDAKKSTLEIIRLKQKLQCPQSLTRVLFVFRLSMEGQNISSYSRTTRERCDTDPV